MALPLPGEGLFPSPGTGSETLPLPQAFRKHGPFGRAARALPANAANPPLASEKPGSRSPCIVARSMRYQRASSSASALTPIASTPPPFG